MTLEQIACHGRNLASLAEKAIELRTDAQTYRALGKVQLADLLDQDAADWEARARAALKPGPKTLGDFARLYIDPVALGG